MMICFRCAKEFFSNNHGYANICNSCFEKFQEEIRIGRLNPIDSLKARIAELEKTNEILRKQLEENQGSFW